MFRRLIAGFLSACFVLLSVPLALTYSAYNTFSDEDFYRGEFVYLSYELIVSQFPKMLDFQEYEYFSEEDLIDLARGVFVKDDLSLVLDSLIEQFKSVEVSDDSELEFTIPLTWLTGKDVVIADALAYLFKDKLPECNFVNDDFNFAKIDCLPSNISQKKLALEIKNTLKNETLADLHDEYVFALRLPGKFEGNLSDYVDSVVKVFFAVALGVLLLLLFLIGLFVYKPFINVLRSVMKTIFISSFWLSGILWLLLWLPSVLKQNLSSNLESDIIFSFSTLVVGAVARNVLLYSMPVLLVSLILYIVAAYRYKKYLSNVTQLAQITPDIDDAS